MFSGPSAESAVDGRGDCEGVEANLRRREQVAQLGRERGEALGIRRRFSGQEDVDDARERLGEEARGQAARS